MAQRHELKSPASCFPCPSTGVSCPNKAIRRRDVTPWSLAAHLSFALSLRAYDLPIQRCRSQPKRSPLTLPLVGALSGCTGTLSDGPGVEDGRPDASVYCRPGPYYKSSAYSTPSFALPRLRAHISTHTRFYFPYIRFTTQSSSNILLNT